MDNLALRVRIGGDIKGLNKALNDAVNAVRKSGASLSEASNAMSRALTLPFLAFGAVAVKAAGEMEGLNKSMVATFEGAGRSAAEAATETDALRKAAQAPGLDFEQAVKASLRLQGVGLSAEKARGTISQLANAIATTGGTAENLNGVTVQLSQMISKGKILNEDLMILKENMPGLSKILNDTFGTDQAEKLRAMGIDGRKFVEGITTAMEKLPRVEGGISNAIVNAGNAIKTSLATIGESINKTLNVTGGLEAFAMWIESAAKRFSELSEGTKTALLSVVAFAIALGPAIKIGQAVSFVVGQMSIAYLRLQKILLTGVIPSIQAMDKATKLTILGGAVAVILAAAAAFSVLGGESDKAAQSQKVLNEVTQEANKTLAKQTVDTDMLIRVLQSENATYAERKQALDALKAIAPDYFKNLSLEKGGLEGIAEAQKLYLANVLKMAMAQAAQKKLVEVSERLLDAQMGVGQSTSYLQDAYAGMAAMIAKATGQSYTFADAQKEYAAQNGQKLIPGLQAQRVELVDIILANTDLGQVVKDVTGATNDNADSTDKNTESKKRATEAAKAWEQQMVHLHKTLLAQQRQDIDDIMSTSKPFAAAPLVSQQKTKSPFSLGGGGEQDALVRPVQMGEEAVKKYADTFENRMKAVQKAIKGVDMGPITVSVQDFVQKATKWLDKAIPGFAAFSEKAEAWGKKYGEAIQYAAGVANDMFGSIAGLSDAAKNRAIANLDEEMKHKLQGVKEGSAEEIRIKEQFEEKKAALEHKAAKRAKALAIIMATINAASGVLKGLATAGPIGAAAAAIIGAIQVATIIATPLAKGGIVSGPTHALVGEYPGARSNPEVVAPLDKLKGMLGGGAGGHVTVGGTFRIQGTDLVLVLQKESKRYQRVNGNNPFIQ